MRRVVPLLAVLTVALTFSAPAPADASSWWSAAKAERHLELNYRNVFRANCTGRGARTGRRYRRFACGLIYTDFSVGTAALRSLSTRRAYVVFFS
jgi:hypothetical protein